MYADVHRRLTAAEAAPDGPLTRWTVEVLGGIATGAVPLAAVRHPLGFVCLPVERAGRRGVCVHLWSDRPPAAAPTTSAVHAHSWDLLSHVVHGRLRNETFDVVDDPAAPTHRLFEVHSDDDVDDLRATDRLVRYATAERDVLDPGATYRVAAGRFHTTVVPPGGRAVTVALGEHRPGFGDLSLGPLTGPTHRVRRFRCDDADTAALARAAAAWIA